MKGLSGEYVKHLEEKEVFKLTREDRATEEKRKAVNEDIRKREEALEKARFAESRAIAQL